MIEFDKTIFGHGGKQKRQQSGTSSWFLNPPCLRIMKEDKVLSDAGLDFLYKRHFVYALVDQERVFYVGRSVDKLDGNIRRRYYHHIYDAKHGNMSLVHKEIRRILQCGRSIEFRILQKGLSYEESRLAERDWINRIGLDNLCNESKGGEGAKYGPNKKPSSQRIKVFLEKDGESGVFDSLTLAAKFLNTETSCVHNHLKNGRKFNGWKIDHAMPS